MQEQLRDIQPVTQIIFFTEGKLRNLLAGTDPPLLINYGSYELIIQYNYKSI